MAVQYHTHTFDIPVASNAEAAARVISDKVVVPSNLGSAAFAGDTDFATAAQGALADSSLQPDDIGASVQAYDADLTAIAGLTSAADKVPYATGSGTWALADLTSAGRALLDDADAATQRTTLGLGTAAVENAGFFAQVANNLSDLADKGTAQDNIQLGAIFADVATAQSATIPPRNKRLRTQFYATANRSGGANYRRISFADLGSYPALSYFRSQDRFMPDGSTDNTNGGYWLIDELAPSITMFSGVGDGSADDQPAVQAGLTWWGLVDNRVLIFDQGKRFLMNSGASVDCDGRMSPGSIIMHGSVKSAANVAALFTFTNVRGGRFGLRVYGGGQTADYTQADPVGKNEAFRFVNAYGSVIEYVEGMEYAGRALRVTSDTPGSGGFRSQWLEIKKVYCNSSAAIGAAEATRLANGVGQAFYIDTGLGAFGTIEKVFTLWELYGPIVDDTTDVTIMDIESLWRGNTGMKLRGVISFWGRLLNLGSELAGWTGDLLKIENSAVSGACQNINIDSCFAIGGYNGVSVENVGSIAGQGLNIRSLISRLNTNRGLLMSGCSEFDIGLLASYGDVVALELSGTNDNGRVNAQITASKRQAIIISSGTSNVHFTGSALNGNTDVAATTSLVDVNTTSAILFEGFYASSANVDYLIDIVSSNTTRVRDGRLVASGGAAIFNNDPNRARGNIGLVTESSAIATILNGTSSIVVTHGLIKAPQWVGVTSRTTGSVDLYVDTIGATQFTIRTPAAVGADTPVLWEAMVNYSG